MLSPAVRRALLAGYRRMHAAPLIGKTRTGFDQLHQRARLAREGGAPLAPDLDALLAQCARAEAAIQAAGPSLAVCHNDSYAANFMINDAGDVRIIDWEYAANNDPCWDLAMIAMSQNASAIADMVTDYLGEPCARTTARLRAYAPVVFISWGLWAALQSRVSTIPFDFRKYSKTLTQLGRAKLRDPAWEAALWAL
jgi:thiamine kinase-like enzyme